VEIVAEVAALICPQIRAECRHCEGIPMSVEESWQELCQKLITERDPETFTALVNELFLLLEQREAQLRSLPKAS
jgi:hypothetical protein